MIMAGGGGGDNPTGYAIDIDMFKRKSWVNKMGHIMRF